MAEGAALPVTEISCALRSPETSLIPVVILHQYHIHGNVLSHLIHTIELIERCRDGFDACLAAERHGESSFERRNHDRKKWFEMIVERSIGMRLSRAVAMFMCEMVGWFVMRASQRGQPHAARCSLLAISTRLHLRRLGSLARTEVGSATLCHWPVQTSPPPPPRHYHSNITARQQFPRRIPYSQSPSYQTILAP